MRAQALILSDYEIVGRDPEFSADGSQVAFAARPVDHSTGPDVFVWRVGQEQAVPATFHHADLMVLNKIDLLPYVPFNADVAKENARRVQPGIEIVDVSCTTGEGLDRWRAWLDRHL